MGQSRQNVEGASGACCPSGGGMEVGKGQQAPLAGGLHSPVSSVKVLMAHQGFPSPLDDCDSDRTLR
jgi:hypothetical protein